MKNAKLIWGWVGVVVAVLLLVWGLSVWLKPGTGQAPGEYQNPPVSPAYAPAGEVTPQFPKELILDTAASVKGSYAINYSGNTNQYTAVWTSSSSISSLADKYAAYFKTGGWTIITQNAPTPALRTISAKNTSGGAANVVIVKMGNGSQITISYLLK